MALTKAEIRQRRWVKTRIGYLESDNARIIKLLSDRISELEHLLLRSHDPSWPPIDPGSDLVVQDTELTGSEQSEGRLPPELMECDACQRRFHFRGWSLKELEASHQTHKQ